MSKVIVDEIQTDTTNGNVRVIPNGTGALEVKGAGGDDAMLQLNCSQQSHGVKLKSPAHSAGQSYTMILPDNNIDVSVVVGKPFKLPLIEKPTKVDVDKWHNVYIENMVELFEKNKEKYAYKGKDAVLELY